MRTIAVLAAIVLVSSAAFGADRQALIAMGQKPQPPVMSHRDIAPPAERPKGEQLAIVDGDCKTVLFIPADYALPADGHVNLTVHFHGAVWFSIDEHLRRGLTEPLLVVTLGEGSSGYAKPFAADTERFGRLIAAVEAAISEQRNGAKARVTRIDITSFSAGYGAVREILKQDKYIARIRRVILCDSLYASWDPATTQPGATSRPSAQNMDPFEKFVRLAAAGEKTFVLVHSSVPTPYANTAATAKWLATLVDAPRVEIEPNSSPASSDKDFPLLYRADIGHLHLWGYGGVDAQAHLTHVRHLADVWRALDACGDR